MIFGAVRDEELGDVGTHEGDGYDGVAENVGPGFGEEAVEVIGVGLAGREHGGSDGDDVSRVGEGRLVRGVGELEGV